MGFGINCEEETAHALSLGGSACEYAHFNQFFSGFKTFEEFQILVIPGGFSFGDDIQSGRVLANKFRYKLASQLRKFIDDGKPVLGVCNGFQMLIQLGALPAFGKDWSDRPLTLMRNKSGKFEGRWVRMRTEASKCRFTRGIEYMTAPVRHGEGQVALRDMKTLEALIDGGFVALRYAGPDGLAAADYPDNPNGSADAIAGICNEGGNVLGLMPHPECHVRYVQSMRWAASPPNNPELRHEGFVDGFWRTLLPQGKPEDFGNSLQFWRNIADSGKKYI